MFNFCKGLRHFVNVFKPGFMRPFDMIIVEVPILFLIQIDKAVDSAFPISSQTCSLTHIQVSCDCVKAHSTLT